jgi:predicted nuclease of predicted toxin-antitoxin system
VRVLLDGCVPRRLAKELSVHEVQTAPELGWGNLDDGPLLDVMSGRFDVLITVDKSLSKQQQLNHRPFAVIVLRAKTNRLADLLPLVPALRIAIEELRPGQVRELAG